MKKIIAAALAAFIIIFMVNCAQPKPTGEARILSVKAKLYDVERSIARTQAELDKKTGFTKAVKDANSALKRSLESDKRELREIQERLESFASSSGTAMEDFILEVERSADLLVSRAGRAIDEVEERWDE